MLQPTNVRLPSSDLPTVHDEIEMGRGFNRKPLTKVAGEFHGGAAAWCSHVAAVASHWRSQAIVLVVAVSKKIEMAGRVLRFSLDAAVVTFFVTGFITRK